MSFDIPIFSLPDEKESIALETKKRRRIANEIPLKASEFMLRTTAKFIRDHGTMWKQRKHPTNGYNCAGHVWASRRTAIYAESEYNKIYEDDSYKTTSSPMSGDLVVYRDLRGGIMHVGRVIELVESVVGLVPRIISKLNDHSGEFIHSASDYPDFESLEYWTDRYEPTI